MQQSIRNPRTGLHDYKMTLDTPVEIGEQAASIRKAQKEWASKPLAERIVVLQNWASKIALYKEEIMEALSIDTGRKRIAQTETEAILGLIHGWCFRAPIILAPPLPRPSRLDEKVMMHEQLVPFGLVGVISPWNFPLLLALIDSIPALLAGSGVMLKPSEVTPRFMDPLEKSIQDVPELRHVFKLIRGGAEQGQALIKNVDAICFTGSVETGMKVAQTSVEKFIPSFLELGGKDPAVILEDANMKVAVDAVLRSCIGATGQACQSLERIYVHENIHDAFVEALTEKAALVTLNKDRIDEGIIGPVIFEQQAEKLEDQINDAIREGAKVMLGGKIIDAGGMWCEPTILTNVHHRMKVMTEETFGPIIPIMAFKTEDEGIAMANESKYGLSGSVFSSDPKRALSVASQINAGAISINDASLTTRIFDGEKNSFNLSGMNASRMGDMGMLRFFRKKIMMHQTAMPQEIFDMEE